MTWLTLVIAIFASMAFLMLAALFLQHLLRNAGWTDAFWSLSVGLCGAVAALAPVQGAPADPLRSRILALVILLWGLRLFASLALRSARGPEDARYAAIRRKAGPKFFSTMAVFLQIQALAGAAFVLCVALCAHAPWALGALQDWLGVAIAAGGLLLETAADAQLAAFRKASGPGRVCDQGLWRASRHPNYVGECVFWMGWAVLALPLTAAYPIGWAALLAPLFSHHLLRRVSGTPLLEAVMAESRGEAWTRYAEKTPVFFPTLSSLRSMLKGAP